MQAIRPHFQLPLLHLQTMLLTIRPPLRLPEQLHCRQELPQLLSAPSMRHNLLLIDNRSGHLGIRPRLQPSRLRRQDLLALGSPRGLHFYRSADDRCRYSAVLPYLPHLPPRNIDRTISEPEGGARDAGDEGEEREQSGAGPEGDALRRSGATDHIYGKYSF